MKRAETAEDTVSELRQEVEMLRRDSENELVQEMGKLRAELRTARLRVEEWQNRYNDEHSRAMALQKQLDSVTA